MSNDLDQRAHAQALRALRRSESGARARQALLIVLFAALVTGLLAGLATTPQETLRLAGPFLYAEAQRPVMAMTGKDVPMHVSIEGKTYDTGAQEVLSEPWLRGRMVGLFERVAIGLILGCGAAIAGLWLTKDKRQRKAAAELADRYISGTQLVSAQTLAKATANPDDPAPLFIGSVPIPRGFETRHFELDGSTGSGKTTAMRQMLDGIEARGEPAIIYDISGSFVAQYYNPVRGDIILSPFDARGAYWNLFDEIQHPADAARLARYLINETGDRDRDVWLETARILVANILRQLWEEKRGTPTALIEALQYMTSEELGRWLAHTSSARTFAQDAERATASVLFMLAKAVNLLMFLRAEPEPGAKSFSFAAFFKILDQHKNGTRAPWVFVPRKEDYFEAVKPLMALWLECAASATLALPPSNTRRLWFVLDEFPDLPRVDNMTRLLPQGRQFGAAVILTFQTIGQMRSRYGEQDAQAILGNCNTKLFLQLSDTESRERASGTIGKVEVEIQTVSGVMDTKTRKPQITVSSRREVRPAVMESLFRLPPGRGYLLLPDGFPVAQITLSTDHIAARGAPKAAAFEAIDPAKTFWGKQDRQNAVRDEAALEKTPSKTAQKPTSAIPPKPARDRGPV
ncbi:type IV secretion system DNA-binding domain-containing protein [Acetobacter okinawensis]|uniref:type IV secretion system DNA-binding domain-containing protein n=1 Tax=Acetobacter okinawensis TaxID=1076594 RepID=UPI000471CF62|nr:type IV secretion system DNA-binding domain-containing protein [Acetobacter okinawensis]